MPHIQQSPRLALKVVEKILHFPYHVLVSEEVVALLMADGSRVLSLNLTEGRILGQSLGQNVQWLLLLHGVVGNENLGEWPRKLGFYKGVVILLGLRLLEKVGLGIDNFVRRSVELRVVFLVEKVLTHVDVGGVLRCLLVRINELILTVVEIEEILFDERILDSHLVSLLRELLLVEVVLGKDGVGIVISLNEAERKSSRSRVRGVLGKDV